HLVAYTRSAGFASLDARVRYLRAELKKVRYSLSIKGTRVSVGPYEGEPDYSSEIDKVFGKFRQGAVREFLSVFRDFPDANHVHAQVLERLAKLYPELFSQMEAFYARHKNFLDLTVAAFDRDVQFYLAYLVFTQKLRSAGLAFAYPEVSEQDKATHVEGSFDLALAVVLTGRHEPVVCNDVHLAGSERILVVTGPNQGGKTTFARMFGQLHFLAALGLPVPGRRARLFLPDSIFSHFERGERLDSFSGKLDDELVRARDILAQATGRSVLVMNEAFSSTTLAGSLFIGAKVLERVSELGALCAYVTFADELACLNEATVSVAAGTEPTDADVRTYKVERRPADGRAYARALAQKHGLSYGQLRQRLAR
ncbi:MAG: MutS-related protein, partial [Acidimicrobiales bacterium]